MAENAGDGMPGWMKYAAAGGLFLLLLPLALTALISGREAVAVVKEPDLESCLPMILCQEIPWDFQEETLKAQAVLARSSLYFYRKENGSRGELPGEELSLYQEEKDKKEYREAYERMEKAVQDTRGEVLMYKGEVCRGAFHRISAGTTRSGEEVLGDAGYLDCVESVWDLQSEGYLTGHYFSLEAFRQRAAECFPRANLTGDSLEEQLEILKRDSSDYVLEIRVGDQTVQGEEFREKLELSSSNFTIQELDGKLRFLCKGAGHGLGMSQYGANAMAGEGKSYRDILLYYFPEGTLGRLSGLS